MNRKEKLLQDIECKGFDYALNFYDDYYDVPDPKFQELYRGYLYARKVLQEYLGVED
jgi:hypothetical protein